jgi:hypothetical protein
MRNIYRFHWDCGRQGDLDSIFIATPEEVEDIIGKRVWFGEILGKHSEVYGVIDRGEITLISNDQEFTSKFEQIMGADFSLGPNPLEHINKD